jgi:predicted MFS family arabinose efflux permease
MRRPWVVAAALFGVNLLNYIDRQVLFAVFPPLQAELRLSDTQLGLLASAFMWVYLSAAPVFGLLADRGPRPRLMGMGVALWSVATGLAGVVRSYGALLASRALVGIGEASYGAIAPALISDTVRPAARGKALAFFSMAIPVGSALGYLLGGLLAERFGWRSAFLVVGVPGLLLAWGVGRMADPPRGGLDPGGAPAALAGGPRLADYLALCRTRSYVLNCLAMTAMTFVVGGLAAWIPTYLVRVRGMTLGQANLVFGVLTLLSGVLGTVAGGWLGDRLRRRIPAAYLLVSGIGLALSAPCAAGVILAPERSTALTLIFAAEVLIFLNTGPLNAVIADVSAPAVRATAYAVNIFVIHALGDAISPAIVGAISDRLDLPTALWVAPVGLLAAAAFCFWGMRGYGREDRVPRAE